MSNAILFGDPRLAIQGRGTLDARGGVPQYRHPRASFCKLTAVASDLTLGADSEREGTACTLVPSPGYRVFNSRPAVSSLQPRVALPQAARTVAAAHLPPGAKMDGGPAPAFFPAVH